jgi:hypothetical protein
MRKLLLASVAVLALGAAPALAQSDNSNAGAAIGGSAGAAAGATAGFFLGGPVGAVIGGFTGAALGASAAVPKTSVTYVETHPVQPVYLDGPVSVGTAVNKTVDVYPIDGDSDHGYFYANGRAYIVSLNDRKVIASPGYVVPRQDRDYVLAHKSDTVTIKENVSPGYKVSGGVKLGKVPDSAYSYVYINGQPALVDNDSRQVVWIGND